MSTEAYVLHNWAFCEFISDDGDFTLHTNVNSYPGGTMGTQVDWDRYSHTYYCRKLSEEELALAKLAGTFRVVSLREVEIDNAI